MLTNIERIPYDDNDVHLIAKEARLRYEALPQDPPIVKKKLLTEMAACEGNVDRYFRLTIRARAMDNCELLCVIRGIYHHTMYALRWADEMPRNSPRVQAIVEADRGEISKAILARRIMLNDPREFYTTRWPDGAPQPYLIWWPLRPDGNMLLMLADKVPDIREQVASIFCDYEDVYKSFSPFQMVMSGSMLQDPATPSMSKT